MLAFKPALIGFIAGSIVWLFFRIFGRTRLLSTNEIKVLKLILILLISTSAIVGIIKIVREAARYAPHVIYTSGEITKLSNISYASYIQTSAVLVWKMSSKDSSGTPISWNGDRVSVYCNDTTIFITNQNQILNRVKLGNDDDIWYVSELYALPFKFQKGHPDYLAVLAQVRTLRDCSILLVFAPKEQLIYEEILKYIHAPSKSMRKMSNPADGREFLVAEVDFPIVYGNK